MSGRKATTDIIPGRYILSVGKPNMTLPKNWYWVLLSDVATLATGHTPSRKKPEYWNGEIPWMAVGDARKVHGKTITETKEYTNQLGIDNSAAVLLPAGTVCLSRTASIGYSVILGREMSTSQGFVNWICSDLLNPRFLQLIFMVENQFLNELAEGIAHTTIYFPEVKAFNIGLPSKKIQDLICEKVDKMFFQLDEVKARLEIIPELLKNFRQAVLNQAVTGKLTEEWRRKTELDDWKESNVGDFMVEVKEKMNPQESETTNYVGLEHLLKDGGIIDKSTSEALKSSKTVFRSGDVLYGKLRPYLNKHDVVNFNGVCSTDILVYRNQFEPSAHFFNYFLGTNSFIQKANSESKGINLPRVSSKIINKFSISIPSKEEQIEIVKRVETLFSKADQIQKSYQILLKKVENLPQAILQKAFKGDLVKQLPTDGDAKSLLEEIKKLKEELKPKRKKKL
ncbi:MAG: hypothetical protein GY739_04405 [Mesoflavibacter sp.]|nr:hypothetical protein [Mesoflavibacter sp.]